MFLTLLASFGSAAIGGLIGAAAIVLVYRGERRARQAEVFNGAIADLMREMSARASLLRAHGTSYPYVPGQSLDNSRVVSAIAVAQVSATQGEYEVLQALASPIAFVSLGSQEFSDEAGHYEAWVAALMIWRRGIITSVKAKVDFQAAENYFLAEIGVDPRTS
jgi:hypothetical protein